jgi:sulfur-carrier protein
VLVLEFGIQIRDFDSMRASIHIPPALSTLTDNRCIFEVGGSTVGQCLDELVDRFPDIKERLFGADGRLEKNIEVFVNLKSTFPDELNRAIVDGDEIQIVEMLAGG